jgi:hypothetical protein
MPRTKKDAPAFEIDFKFPQRSREFLFREDGTDKYDVPTLLQYASNSQKEYTVNFVANVKEQYNRHGVITNNQKWTLENLAAEYVPEWDEINAKFFEWYDARPDMQELYQFSTKNQYWFYDRDGMHHSNDVAASKGWVERPISWRMFQSVANSWEAVRYRELKRDVVYDIGDMVQLRQPFVNNWRYDPMHSYGTTPPATTARIGTVVELKEELHRKSRGGKGSRLINVLWLSTGNQTAVPERALKKMPKPK